MQIRHLQIFSVDIANLEPLILISNGGTIKFEDQSLLKDVLVRM